MVSPALPGGYINNAGSSSVPKPALGLVMSSWVGSGHAHPAVSPDPPELGIVALMPKLAGPALPSARSSVCAGPAGHGASPAL